MLDTFDMVATYLKKEHQVILARDAKTGIMHFIDSAPDVVFLDIHLPDMKGHEVLKRLRLLDPTAYVVMLSGDSVRENVAFAQEYGAAGFIRKPFPKERILQYVQQCPTMNTHATVRALGWRNAP